MKVAFLNTYYQSGGAAIAAKRLQDALTEHVDVCYITQDAVVQDQVVSVSNTPVKKILSRVRFIGERLYFLFFERNKDVRFQFSPANTGIDLTSSKEFQEADVIHLHWINQGFVSLAGLKKIIQSGKPIVITMHDFWYFTGGCHYPSTCVAYLDNCGNCPMLKSPSDHDLSYKIHLIKEVIFTNTENIVLVGCSNWLAEEAKKSSLGKNLSITSIANALPIDVFTPLDQANLRAAYNVPINKKLILFGAMKIADPRKGFNYFKQALHHLQEADALPDTEIIVFGSVKDAEKAAFENFPVTVHYLGKIPTDKIMELYSLADIYVSPSLEDNLPNTVAEAMACGIPVIAFHTGGLPEMIDHKENGYLAAFKDSKDLAAGMNFLLAQKSLVPFMESARNKAVQMYNPERVAQSYIQIYKSLINK